MGKKNFLHDTDSIRDVKVVKMMTDYGFAGFGYYWAVVAELYRNGGRYELKDLGILAKEIGIDLRKLKSFIFQCSEKYTHRGKGLFSFDENHFWSDSLLKRMAKKPKKEQKQVSFMDIDGINCVHLVEEDYKSLCSKYGDEVVNTGIKILDDWLSLRGRRAQSYLGKDYNHIGHFRADGWVINTAKEKLAKVSNPIQAPSQEELIRKLNLCK